MNIIDRVKLAKAKKVAKQYGYTVYKNVVTERTEHYDATDRFIESVRRYGFDEARESLLNEVTDPDLYLKLYSAKSAAEAEAVINERFGEASGTSLTEIAEKYTTDGLFYNIAIKIGLEQANALFLSDIKKLIGVAGGISLDKYKEIIRIMNDRYHKNNIVQTAAYIAGLMQKGQGRGADIGYRKSSFRGGRF